MDIEELLNDPDDGLDYKEELRDLIDKVDGLQMTLNGLSPELMDALNIDGTESLDDLDSIISKIPDSVDLYDDEE